MIRCSAIRRKQTGSTRWRDAVQALRTLCPVTKYEVTVRRSRMAQGDDGECRQLDKHRLFVKVNREIPAPFDLEVLVHEWAHAMTWDLEHDRCPSHSAYWGVAYADAYRAVFNPRD